MGINLGFADFALTLPESVDPLSIAFGQVPLPAMTRVLAVPGRLVRVSCMAMMAAMCLLMLAGCFVAFQAPSTLVQEVGAQLFAKRTEAGQNNMRFGQDFQ